ncbi:MAG: type II CRISPR RNA-guided endonuclease Cas9, partial [Saprospiraceae bacterium]
MSNSKRILGLDIGTNSIGWAFINHDFDNKTGDIIDMGVRVIPMSQDAINDFNKGILQSEASTRTGHRGVRRLYDRARKRRDRLVKVLKVMGYIDDDFVVNDRFSWAYEIGEDNVRFKFEASYQEMVEIFKSRYPSLKGVPRGWTIYYLRQKALSEKISKEELAWVIMQFNTKRGYNQLRGDTETDTVIDKRFVSDLVVKINVSDEEVRGKMKMIIELEDGVIGEYIDKFIPDWIGKQIEFVITEKTLKDGALKVTLTTPGDDDWTLRKKKTEQLISSQNVTLGAYIFNILLDDPMAKIRGKAVHTIDRKFYKSELNKIIEKQGEFHSEFDNKLLLIQAASALYKRNIKHRENLIKRSMQQLIVDDVLFYQRPLKSKKYLISNCKEESYKYNTSEGFKTKPVKGIAKSHPMFQEYRIWGIIHNLKILQRALRSDEDKLLTNVDVSANILTYESKAELYNLFSTKKEIKEKDVLKLLNLESKAYKWNYEEGHKFEGKTTLFAIKKAFKNEPNADIILADPSILENIWHALYSLRDSTDHLRTALTHVLSDVSSETISALLAIAPYDKNYGAYSKKALNKLLPLMRCGHHWNEGSIENNTLTRIQKIITGEFDAEVRDTVREAFTDKTDVHDFQGLAPWESSYVVYNRHSEMLSQKIYAHPNDLKINEILPQGVLRNPTVEKIIRETLLLTRDVWDAHGKADEIHVELAREMKLSGEKRNKLTQTRNQNYATNQRAKAMLRELQKANGSINPYSKGHLETFKLYEETALSATEEIDDNIKAIRSKGDPTPSEINKYKMWLEQKYLSPYTGSVIPLSKLYESGLYEVDHIIPQALHYDNSFSNKVICEAKINAEKSNKLPYQAVIDFNGKTLK